MMICQLKSSKKQQSFEQLVTEFWLKIHVYGLVSYFCKQITIRLVLSSSTNVELAITDAYYLDLCMIKPKSCLEYRNVEYYFIWYLFSSYFITSQLSWMCYSVYQHFSIVHEQLSCVWLLMVIKFQPTSGLYISSSTMYQKLCAQLKGTMQHVDTNQRNVHFLKNTF